MCLGMDCRGLPHSALIITRNGEGHCFKLCHNPLLHIQEQSPSAVLLVTQCYNNWWLLFTSRFPTRLSAHVRHRGGQAGGQVSLNTPPPLPPTP